MEDLVIFFLRAFSILYTLGSGFGLLYVWANKKDWTAHIELDLKAYAEFAVYLTSIYAWFI
jgi:hypothetical protein